jgi:hypothetical protein
MNLTPATLESLLALALGFAVAGLLASTYELLTERKASFSLLQSGGLVAVASVPLVVFTAPFLILRNTVRGRKIEGRPIQFVILAAMIAATWSLISGFVMLDLVRALTV